MEPTYAINTTITRPVDRAHCSRCQQVGNGVDPYAAAQEHAMRTGHRTFVSTIGNVAYERVEAETE